jgi:predicted transcriptional regulator
MANKAGRKSGGKPSDDTELTKRTMLADELVNDKKLSQKEAAKVIGEDVNQSTVSRLLQKGPTAMRVQKSLEDYVTDHYADLQALKAEAAGIPKLAQKIEVLLAILDREMKLLGTAAPTRTESKNVNVNVEAPLAMDFYNRMSYEWRGVLVDRWEEAFLAVRETLAQFKTPQKPLKEEVAEICKRFPPMPEEPKK